MKDWRIMLDFSLVGSAENLLETSNPGIVLLRIYDAVFSDTRKTSHGRQKYCPSQLGVTHAEEKGTHGRVYPVF